MDVPAMAWKKFPGGPPATSSGTGVWPARIWAPGAETSGLIQLVPGPRDEKPVMTSPWVVAGAPVGKLPVAPGLAARNASRAAPSGCSRCTVGRKWLSVSVSDSDGVDEDHPGRAALQHVEAALDPADHVGGDAGGRRRACR